MVTPAPARFPGEQGHGTRVFLIRSSPRMGGLERSLLTVAAGLMRLGWHVTVVMLSRHGTHPALLQAREVGVPVYAVPDPAPWSLSPLRYLWRLVQTERPHLLYAWDYKSNFLVYLVARLVSPSPVVIAAAHGYTEADMRQRVYRLVDLHVLRRVAMVVTPSPFMQRELAASGIPPAHVQVIPPAIPWTRLDRWATSFQDVEFFDREGGAPLLLFVGRLSVDKGPDRLLNALPHVWAFRSDVRGGFVGDGPLLRPLQRASRRLGPPARVQFWGWQENPYPFLRSATCVVVPSRREGFGMVALEAQGLGTAVVATRVGHLPHVVHPPNILVPDTDDPRVLAEALLTCLQSVPKEREARMRLQFRVRDTFSPQQVVARHRQLFTRVLDGGVR